MNTIVILHSTSRESINKANQFAGAAVELGCTPFLTTIEDTPEELLAKVEGKIVAVLPCSDSCSEFAASLAQRVGLISGDTSLNALGSKTGSYSILESLGFPVLPHHLVNTIDDIANSPLAGPVFIKPDRSSGAFSPHPWGYKMFVSKEALVDYLVSNDYVREFESDGYKEHIGSYLLMEAVTGVDGMFCVSAVQREDAVSTFGRCFVYVENTDHFYRYCHFDDSLSELSAVESLIGKMWDAGLKSPFLYIQCLKKNGVLYPIDVNTRLSTYLDSYATKFDKDFYRRALQFILGQEQKLSLNFAKSHTIMTRIRVDVTKPVLDIDYDKTLEGVEPVNLDELGVAGAGYDIAYSCPTFCVSNDDYFEIIKVTRRLRQSVTIKQ